MPGRPCTNTKHLLHEAPKRKKAGHPTWGATWGTLKTPMVRGLPKHLQYFCGIKYGIQWDDKLWYLRGLAKNIPYLVLIHRENKFIRIDLQPIMMTASLNGTYHEAAFWRTEHIAGHSSDGQLTSWSACGTTNSAWMVYPTLGWHHPQIGWCSCGQNFRLQHGCQVYGYDAWAIPALNSTFDICIHCSLSRDKTDVIWGLIILQKRFAPRGTDLLLLYSVRALLSMLFSLMVSRWSTLCLKAWNWPSIRTLPSDNQSVEYSSWLDADDVSEVSVLSDGTMVTAGQTNNKRLTFDKHFHLIVKLTAILIQELSDHKSREVATAMEKPDKMAVATLPVEDVLHEIWVSMTHC